MNYNEPYHCYGYRCPMYIYLKTIGVRDMEGFSDSLKRVSVDILNVSFSNWIKLNVFLSWLVAFQ